MKTGQGVEAQRRRHKAHFADVQLLQDLRAGADNAVVRQPRAVIGDRGRRGKGLDVGQRPRGAGFLTDKHQRPQIFRRNTRQRPVQGPPRAIRNLRAQHIAEHIHRLHAHQGRLLGGESAAGEGVVQRIVDKIAKHVEFEVAVFDGDGFAAHALDGLLVQRAVGDQVGNRADGQAVLARKRFELRAARHAAVFIHDFDDQSGRFEPGQARQIDARLGVPGAAQHAAGFGHQRKDIARLADVRGPGLFARGYAHRVGALDGADART